MRIITLIKSIDFFGPDMKLRINQQENFKTVFGGIISILYYISFLIFFLQFGGDFFNKRNPKIVAQTLTDTSFNKTLRLNKNNFFFAFRIRDETGDELPNINLNYKDKNTIFEYIVFKDKKLESIPLPIKNCTESDFALFNIPNYNKTNYYKSNFFCANFSAIQHQLEIGGYYDTTDFFYSFILLKLQINQNFFTHLNNKTNSTQTQQYLKLIQRKIHPEVIVPEPIFDPNDYENPLKYEAKHIFSALSFESDVRDHIFFSDYVVETDHGIMFEKVDSTNKTGFAHSQQYHTKCNLTDFNAVYEFSINYHRAYYLSTRQYTKFQELLGNIMGFMDMIAFVFSFLISFNSDYRLGKYIANKLIFIFDADEKKNYSCNSKCNRISFFRYKKEIDGLTKSKKQQKQKQEQEPNFANNPTSTDIDREQNIQENRNKQFSFEAKRAKSFPKKKKYENIINDFARRNEESKELNVNFLNKSEIHESKNNENSNLNLLNKNKIINKVDDDLDVDVDEYQDEFRVRDEEALKLRIEFCNKVSKSNNKRNQGVLEYNFLFILVSLFLLSPI